MDKIFNKKTFIIVCCIILAAVYFLVNNFISRSNINETDLTVYYSDYQQNDKIDYEIFLKNNANVSDGFGECKILLGDTENDYATIKANEKRNVVINVEKSGLYSIKLEYCAIDNNLSDYYVSIFINDKLQYKELENMTLKNSWLIDEKSIENQASPELIKNRGKLIQSLYDRNGYHDEPLKVKLESGENIVSISAGQMDLALYSICFYVEKETPTYSEYAKCVSKIKGEPLYFEAEYANVRSSPSIQEQTDVSSMDSTPTCTSLKKVNTIGGNSFATVGDELKWTFFVKRGGTYSFNMRVRQNYSSGSVVYRTLLIDDVIPFEECRAIKIPYKSGWQDFTFKDNNDVPYLFELDEGYHTITLKVTYGDSAQTINKMSTILSELNLNYRKIITLTSPNPDPYRDYHISEKLPDVVENFSVLKDELKNVSNYLVYISKSRGGETSEIDHLIRQLEEFVEDPEEIPSQVATFKSNISALGTWITNKRNQPLEIDNFELLPENVSFQKKNSGLFKQFGFNIKRFIVSFTDDYYVAAEEKRQVEVWCTAGRQQVDVVQKLIDEKFEPNNDIEVNLKLVQGGTLIPAVVAGIGPDVSIMEANNSAVNFAVRKAVKDLSEFEGFDELYSQYDSEAFVPVSFGGAVYGIPESRSFPVMFYRKDIFEELNLEVPNTWNELYSMMMELQKNNMEVGIGSDVGTYAMFLYQAGGSLYNENATKTDILSEKGISTFKKWTKYFSDFDLPLSYNFINRFSSGEMPIAIADYTMYNTLVVFAPEIYDLWDISLVPGTIREDGTLDRSVTSGGSCSILFDSADDPEASWQFIRWWNSADIIQTYARNIEIKMGPSARYPVANKIAFDNMMWTPKQLSVLKDQMQYVKGIPEIPGSYFTSRHITNAFRKTVYESADIKETLVEYAGYIDLEIKEKREELGLN